MFSIIKFIYKREILWFVVPAILISLITVFLCNGKEHVEIFGIYFLFFVFAPFALPAMMVNTLVRNHQWVMTLPLSKKQTVFLYILMVFSGLSTYLIVTFISILMVLKFSFGGSFGYLLTFFKEIQIPFGHSELVALLFFAPFILLISFGGPSSNLSQTPLRATSKNYTVLMVFSYFAILLMFTYQLYYLMSVLLIATSVGFSLTMMVRKMALIKTQKIIIYSLGGLYLLASAVGIKVHLFKSLKGASLEEKVSAIIWTGIKSDEDLKQLKKFYITNDLNYDSSDAEIALLEYYKKNKNSKELGLLLGEALEHKYTLGKMESVIRLYKNNVGPPPFKLQKKYIDLAYEKFGEDGLMSSLNLFSSLHYTKEEFADLIDSRIMSLQRFALIKIRSTGNCDVVSVLLESEDKILPLNLAIANSSFQILVRGADTLSNYSQIYPELKARALASTSEQKGLEHCDQFMETKLEEVIMADNIFYLNRCLRIYLNNHIAEIEKWGKFEPPYTLGMKNVYTTLQATISNYKAQQKK